MDPIEKAIREGRPIPAVMPTQGEKLPGSGMIMNVGGQPVPWEVAVFACLDQMLGELKKMNAALERLEGSGE